MASESRSLLDHSYQRSRDGDGSAPTSKYNTPALGSQAAIRLEDHRPGRPTTFSLLVGTGSGAGTASDSSPPRSRSRSPPRRLASRGDSLRIDLEVGGGGCSTTTGSASDGTPYQFGDGKEGYRILFPSGEDEADAGTIEGIERHVSIAIWLSLIVNIILFVSKTFSAIVSGSLSVAASAVDSALDLVSQGIVVLAERGSKGHDVSRYPAGRSRLEPVGIILCAALMGMAALQLILESAKELWSGYVGHDLPGHVSFDAFTISLLLLTVVAKLALWIYCGAYAKYSPTLYTLAVDHRNDVLSNTVALVAALLAWQWPAAWSADPIGAILMSVYITKNWTEIGMEEIDKIVGRAADPEFIESIRTLSTNFHTEMRPDIIRAYHFGSKYLVELEVILPAEMTVREAHDISLALQQSIEQLASVERAFVHVDWASRGEEDEHDAKEIAAKVKRQSPQNGATGASPPKEAKAH